LTYLYKEHIVDIVITEDSDLLAFGCEKVFFKMDAKGWGVEVDLRNMRKVESPDFKEFTRLDFLYTCILSGCDYLPSIPGVGFKKAHSLV